MYASAYFNLSCCYRNNTITYVIHQLVLLSSNSHLTFRLKVQNQTYQAFPENYTAYFLEYVYIRHEFYKSFISIKRYSSSSDVF